VLHGGSPVDYLSITDPVEQIVADEVLTEVEEIARERRKAFFRDLEIAVANGIGKGFR
jgi:hypothetical protein